MLLAVSEPPIPRSQPTSQSHDTRLLTTPDRHSTTSSNSNVPHVDRVQDYVTQMLHGNLPHVANAQSTGIPRPINPASYNALLPSIWALVRNPSGTSSSSSNTVLNAVVEHAIKVSSTSMVNEHTVQSLGRLALVRRRFRLFCCFHFMVLNIWFSCYVTAA